MRKPGTDETIGNNVHGIRIARRISMQETVNDMRELGHSWSKTTLFSIVYWHQKHLIFSSALNMTPKKTSC